MVHRFASTLGSDARRGSGSTCTEPWATADETWSDPERPGRWSTIPPAQDSTTLVRALRREAGRVSSPAPGGNNPPNPRRLSFRRMRRACGRDHPGLEPLPPPVRPPCRCDLGAGPEGGGRAPNHPARRKMPMSRNRFHTGAARPRRPTLVAGAAALGALAALGVGLLGATASDAAPAKGPAVRTTRPASAGSSSARAAARSTCSRRTRTAGATARGCAQPSGRR